MKDKKGNLKKQNLRWFQYKSPSSSTWGVSVLCDFENDVATVHRIVHSSFIKESTKWIPIQDFNEQIKKENTMKFKRYIRESNGSLDKREQIKNGMIYSYISNNEGLIQTMVDGMVKEIKEVGTILGTHALREKWFKTYTNNGVCVPFDNYIFVINDVGEWYVFEKDCKNREDFILGWHPDIGYREFSELNRGDYFDRALDIFANFENIESTFDKWVEKKLNEY